MLSRNLYGVPGISQDADEEAIRRAYRAIAFGVHPDPSQATEQTGKPLIRRRMRIPDDFASAAPSIGEFLDHVAQNFFGFHRKSFGPMRRMGIEIELTPEEAQLGCTIPLSVPIYAGCASCGGTGGNGWAECFECNGWGGVESRLRFSLELGSGANGMRRYSVDLSDFGIRNLALDIRVFAP